MQRTRIHTSPLNRITHLIRPHRHAAKVERIGTADTNPHRKQTWITRRGGIKGALLLWIIGVPIPLILLFFLIKGCVT
jgi:hypothetical protein